MLKSDNHSSIAEMLIVLPTYYHKHHKVILFSILHQYQVREIPSLHLFGNERIAEMELAQP